jgi:general secretion pathway protein J
MRRHAGFTLIEVLVAITIMALMAVLSWRGLDSMTRAQAQTKVRADDILTLQTGLMQWRSDLDNVIQFDGNGNVSPMDWDGRALRVTRRNTTNPQQGVLVVAWASRATEAGGRWLRWQSAPVRTRTELQQAWQQAAQWAQNPGDAEKRGEIAITPLNQWQVFFYRGNAWTNALSSDASGGPITVLPDGVRLILSLPPGQSLSGDLTLDWVSPTLSGGKDA